MEEVNKVIIALIPAFDETLYLLDIESDRGTRSDTTAPALQSCLSSFAL